MVEHAREEDCEAGVFDLEPAHTEMATSGIALTVVLKERIVAKQTIGGEMVHEIELYTDLEVAEPEPWPDYDYGALDGFDLSIPFWAKQNPNPSRKHAEGFLFYTKSSTNSPKTD